MVKCSLLLLVPLVSAFLSLLYLSLTRGTSPLVYDSLSLYPVSSPPKRSITRGETYHEIFIAYRHYTGLRIAVWNDIRHEKMSRPTWDSIATSFVKSESAESVTVIKNGPRFWMLDSLRGYELGSRRSFAVGGGGDATNGAGGRRLYDFDLVAVIHPSFAELLFRGPYHELKIRRHTDWTYAARSTVYELTSPRGDVYTMQTGSREVIRDASPASSAEMKLEPPTGWAYGRRELNDEETYYISDFAYIIQDEFFNTYQLTKKGGGKSLKKELVERSDEM